jgi:hypothetical protein
MNWDAAEQVIELRDVQSDDKILEVGFGPGVAIQLLLHPAPARIRLRGRRVAGNGASSGGPQRPRVAQRSTSALGADEINTLMTQPGMSRYRPDQGADFIGAIVGALIVLFIWNRLVAARVISNAGTRRLRTRDSRK